jgi:hypothetical protein
MIIESSYHSVNAMMFFFSKTNLKLHLKQCHKSYRLSSSSQFIPGIVFSMSFISLILHLGHLVSRYTDILGSRVRILCLRPNINQFKKTARAALDIIDGAVAGAEKAADVIEELLKLSQGEHREELLAVGKIVDKYKKGNHDSHTRE